MKDLSWLVIVAIVGAVVFLFSKKKPETQTPPAGRPAAFFPGLFNRPVIPYQPPATDVVPQYISAAGQALEGLTNLFRPRTYTRQEIEAISLGEAFRRPSPTYSPADLQNLSGGFQEIDYGDLGNYLLP